MHNRARGVWRHYVRLNERWEKEWRRRESIHARKNIHGGRRQVKKKHKIGQDSNFLTTNAPSMDYAIDWRDRNI